MLFLQITISAGIIGIYTFLPFAFYYLTKGEKKDNEKN